MDLASLQFPTPRLVTAATFGKEGTPGTFLSANRAGGYSKVTDLPGLRGKGLGSKQKLNYLAIKCLMQR